MPYSITTEDGITLDNIPDSLQPDAPELKQRVLQIRAVHDANGKGATAAPAKPAVQPMGRMEKLGMGAMDPVHGGAQLLTNMLPDSVVSTVNKANNWLADNTGLVARIPEGGVDQMVKEREAAYQSQRTAAGEEGFDGYRMAGNVVSPANLAIGARLPGAVTTLGKMGVGAAGGAATAALNPVTEGEFAEEKLKQLAIGTVGGGAVPAVMAGGARVISPNASRNPNVQLLRDEGVNPTIGQTLGGRWNAAEEKLTSVPITGDMIARARRNAMGEFDNAAINRATGPIGERVEGAGFGAVKQAGDKLSQAYDDALSQINVVRFDTRFGSDLSQLRQLTTGLTPNMQARFNKTLQDVVAHRTSQAGGMTAETFKKVDSEIGGLARRYGASSVASEGELGDAFGQLQALLKQQAIRTNPQAAQALAAADEGWANLVRVEGASKAAMNNEGVFTPAQLNMSIRQADKSVRGRAVSRGDALMQDLGNAGQAVLGNKVPNSATADRAMLGGGALLSGAINPAIPAALLAGGAAYTGPVQKALVSAVASRPQSAQAVAQLFRQSSPALSPAASQALLELFKSP